MNVTFKTTTKPEDAANFVASSISHQLGLGNRVLFFVPGGSAIAVAVKISDIIRKQPHENLTIMLTDERYGEINHPDSNWFQLKEQGFSLPEAKIIPVLMGAKPEETVAKFNENLEQELKLSQYKIGLFGMGSDGHTAGILPLSPAAQSSSLSSYYNTPTFSRITVTKNVLEKLDEAVLWVQGENKWQALKDLEKNIDEKEQPVQMLKKVKKLSIFTDFRP